MPPRILGFQSLGTLNGMHAVCVAVCLRSATKSPLALLPVIQTAGLRMTRLEKKIFAKREPYKWAQMQQRKNANVQRQEAAIAEREKGWGSPIHGIPTLYVESFDSVGQKEGDGQHSDGSQPVPALKDRLNHFLTQTELDAALQHAFDMTKPLEKDMVEGDVDPKFVENVDQHKSLHSYRSEVINRIMSLDMASGKMRRHTNIKRCIEDFGRHKTDATLKPKPPSITPSTVPMPGRCGPDTGSSEVQIAILTMKIRKLSQMVDAPKGYKDKHARRDLRLLCHKRQRLLRYMERKERGSERWLNMLGKLGLSPATWKDQLTL